MKKALKIFGIIVGSIIGLIIGIMVFVYIGSKMMNAKYETKNPTYEPNKAWIYKAKFLDQESDATRTDTITLKTYNERFMMTQNKLTWQLNRESEDQVETTGFEESSNRIWLHPPRFDGYYQFTEYSAFPEIRYPLEKGRSWKTQLTLGTYATEESGSQMTMKYEIKRIDTLSLNLLNRKVLVLGQGKSGLGNYTNRMVFTDSLGFKKMTYEKEDGEKLLLELIEKTSKEKY